LLQEPQGHDYFGYAAPHVAPDRDQAAFPGAQVNHGPPPDHLAAENLRWLLSHFLHHPDSQIILVHMEPGAAGRFRIIISLEMVDFL
jgi:hypothetical protein